MLLLLLHISPLLIVSVFMQLGQQFVGQLVQVGMTEPNCEGVTAILAIHRTILLVIALLKQN